MSDKTSEDSARCLNGSGNSCSPYLPQPRGELKEKLTRLRFQVVYWIWKRMICRYSHAWRSGCRNLCFLDVGCGPGDFLCCLERWFKSASINGLDTNEELLEYTADRTATVKVLQGSAEKLPYEDNVFHVVSGFHVIEHLPNPEEFFREANRVLNDRGLLLIATPNLRGLAARIMGDRWVGIRDDHISLRSPEQWRETLDRNGFAVVTEGTTLFRGMPLIGQFPLGAPLQLIQAFFGWFPWRLGASYMVVAAKKTTDGRSCHAE